MTHTILLVEDNNHIMKINSDTLAEAGYHVLEAETAAQARELLERDAPDLIVLDIMLPDGDGLELCRSIRGESNIPILFLSAKKKSAEIVEGLKAGGDDYLSKPYNLEVLLARIEALLRRAWPAGEEPQLRIGAFEMNFTSRRAYLDGGDLLLTTKEFALLEMLVKNRDKILGAKELYEKVWGMDSVGNTDPVKEHVSCLRRKLGGAPVGIETERGEGYRLVNK